MKTYNESNGDSTLKEALYLAQSKLEYDKLQDKRVCLKKSEDRIDSFTENYLYASWFIWLVVTVTAIVLFLIYPPHFILNLLEKFNNSIWVFVISSLVIAILCFGSVMGLWLLILKIGNASIVIRGKKVDEELIAWANKRTGFDFKRIHQKYRGSYGAWNWSTVQANEEFYVGVRKAMFALLSEGVDTAEEAYGLANQEIMIAIKNKNTGCLIIAAYLAISFQEKGIDNTKYFISY